MKNLLPLLLLAASSTAWGTEAATGLAPVRATYHVTTAPVVLDGQPALRVSDVLPPRSPQATRLVLLEEAVVGDGEIELDMAGDVLPTASADARGFVGLAFRVSEGAERYEYFYLRPSNARADDQVRRNHTLQYSAHPGFPWEVLRAKSPERYESYADMEPGRWVHVRAVLQGRSARFYLNRAAQPSLVVNDLKLGAGSGLLGLWVGPGTVAHFANLKVTRH